jgi:hypothetical protein
MEGSSSIRLVSKFKRNYHVKQVKKLNVSTPRSHLRHGFRIIGCDSFSQLLRVSMVAHLFQTWRLGDPNFVIGPEIAAMLLSLLAAAIVFWMVVKWTQQRPNS